MTLTLPLQPPAPLTPTLDKSALTSGAGWLACATAAQQTRFLDDLSPQELLALPYLFEFWAHPHQLPPDGAWRAWVILGGRGAGKTRAGAEWVRAMVEGPGPQDKGRAARVALVGETLDQVREVMVFGDSGILACSPPDRRPRWIATRRCLQWPNGAEAMCFSAHDPEGLRGPQFDAAWVDELAKWKRGDAAWDMLQFALRLGNDPQVCVTTTPRPVPVLRRLLATPSTVTTHAPTEANAAYLADSFLTEVRARYAGTRLGRQELDGVLLDQVEGALWSYAQLEDLRVADLPAFDRIVVAVDPPVTGTARSDACGIVAVGAVTQGPPQDWRAVVLEDASVQGLSPAGWAERAVACAQRWSADRLIAEVNQGGDMVSTIIASVDPLLPVKSVRAGRGKGARAEPVAALYEQGRVRHVAGLDALEDEMVRMTVQGHQGQGSPDRVDALVWAVNEVLIAPARVHRAPRVRLI